MSKKIKNNLKKRNTINSKTNGYKIIYLIVTAVLIIWLASFLVMTQVGENWSERGTIGDSFGAVNALFSGLAFAVLIYAIILQREDLKLHRQELELNRREIHKSAVAQEKSEEALVKQTEQMHLTAKLNAMNTIINYYNIQIANPNNSSGIVEQARAKRRSIIKQIDNLIEELNDSEVD